MRKPSTTDPRWKSFQETGLKCSRCENPHKGVFDLACAKPDYYPHEEEYQPNSALILSGDFLSEDFCVLESKYYFVRAVLEIPILGANGDRFAYGVWTSLSRKRFEGYIAEFDVGHAGDEEWFGYLSNRIKGYDRTTLALKCSVVSQPNRRRPLLFVNEDDHPLAQEQADGITLDRLLEIYANYGHVLAPI